MNWLELQERWIREGNHCYFAPRDEAGIDALERHLRRRRLPYLLRRRPAEEAVVFVPFEAAGEAGRQAA